MNSVNRDIFRAIHEGKWLHIEYENTSNERTRYWIAINNINVEKKALEVTGLHLTSFSTKSLFIFIDKILNSQILEGTYFKPNQILISDIEHFPSRYNFIFSHITNLKTLNYLNDCNKLSDIPKLNNDYILVNKLDGSKIINHYYDLDDDQFKLIVNTFKKSVKIIKENNLTSIYELALNELSIHTPKGLYVLAYRNIFLEVEKRRLVSNKSIKICREFTMEGKEKFSILNFIDPEDLNLSEKLESISESLKDNILNNIKTRKDFSVDDRPYFICLQRDQKVSLEKEYEGILTMAENNNLSVPLQAFFGQLRSIKPRRNILPIALLDKNVNLDQMLSIHNALNYPVSYIQGPPGTGKTHTIINTIISAFFNSKTVLFSSYNNHPIDGVFEKLSSLKYKNFNIPFPILRIGSNARTLESLKHVKQLYEAIRNLKIFPEKLEQDKMEQIEKNKKLNTLLQKHSEIQDLLERKELIESMLSRNENMNLRINLEGQQSNAIKNRLEEIGQVTEDEALSLLSFNHAKLMEFLNFTSVKYLKRFEKKEYDQFRGILNLLETDQEKVIPEFNKYLSNPDNIKLLQKIFPIFCSTCISAHKIGKPEIYFDITIMDEASQCDNAVSLIPIIRGKNLMLVGDPQQLNPVITLDPNINRDLKTKYNVLETYDYIQNSLYKTFLANDYVSQETLLHNHYRCAKEIIDFNNKKYYNNQLKIKTKTEYERPLAFVDIPRNLTQIKNTAPSEIDEMINYIKNNPDKTIGIVTPFKNQKEMIEARLKEENLDKRINCGTVHAFQGDEKDEILFSLALSEMTHQKSYDWLKNNRELLNVGVSRAKNKLIIYSSESDLVRLHKKDEDDDLFELYQYIKHNGDFVVSSRENSSRALGVKPYSTETENTFLTTLNHALTTLLNTDSKYTVKREVQISHLFEKLPSDGEYFFRASMDFVIYQRLSKSKEFPVLAIELDGDEHHNDPDVMQRDQKKKDICKNHGFTLIHVDNSYARRYNFIKDILDDFFKNSV